MIYGYGNPGRQDDGLGNAFIEEIQPWIEAQEMNNVQLESNYQLNIEDAHTMAENDLVVFVDASTEEEVEDFDLTSVLATDASIEFTMHAVSASFVLDLCQKLYQKNPETFLLHIRGYSWEFAEGLTSGAIKNLKCALDFMKKWLQHPENFK